MSTESPRVICPICACPIHGRSDVCGSCHTPHHGDCAAFLGRCATFGCGGKAFFQEDVERIAVESNAAYLGGGSEEGPAEPAAGDRRRLRRSIGSRLQASCALLRSNLSIALPCLALLVLFSLPFQGALLGIGGVLAQAVVVILFVARARGKDSGLGEALRLVNQRGGRILWYSMQSTLIPLVPICIGSVLVGLGMAVPSVLVTIPGALLLWVGLSKLVSYVLVSIVAAMGADDEPSHPLRRSTELVEVGRGQVLASVFVLFAPCMFLGTVMQSWLAGLVVQNLLFLIATTYWLLYYLEARRVLQDDYLPHAPEGFFPGRDEAA